MLIFEPARLIFYKDVNRCPLSIKDNKWIEWNRLEDERLMLIALERYLMIFDYLRKTGQYLR